MQSRQSLLYCNQNVFSNGLLGAHSRHRQHAVSANQTEPGRRCSIGRLIRWRGELRARKAGHGVLKPLRILPVAVPFGSHLLPRIAVFAGSFPVEHARVGRITTPAQRQPRATRLALVADSENRLVRIPRITHYPKVGGFPDSILPFAAVFHHRPLRSILQKAGFPSTILFFGAESVHFSPTVTLRPVTPFRFASFANTRTNTLGTIFPK